MLKNKYRTLILICFFLLVISFQVISAKELPLFQKVIVVDAGHPSYLFPNVWYNK